MGLSDPSAPEQSYRYHLAIFALFLIVFHTAVALTVDLNRPEWGDEIHFVRTARQFGQEAWSLERLQHYEEMSGPLPFMAYGVWGRLCGFELPRLRLFSILVALATYLLYHRLLYSLFHSGRAAFLIAAFLVINPYMIGLSVFVFTDMLPMLFMLAALCAIRARRPVSFGVALACALISRQYYAFFAGAAMLYFLLLYRQDRDRDVLRMFVASVFACVPLLLLVVLWGGPSPDSPFKEDFLFEGFSYHPEFWLVYVFAFLVYLLPFVVLKWKPIYSNRKIVLGCFLCCWIYWLAPIQPAAAAAGSRYDTVGLFHRLLKKVFPSTALEQTVLFLAFALGLPVLVFIARDAWERGKDRRIDLPLLLDLSILTFFLIMPFSYLNWEKYILPLVPLGSIRLALLGSASAEPDQS